MDLAASGHQEKRPMINLQDLTNDQLNHLAARAQDWELVETRPESMLDSVPLMVWVDDSTGDYRHKDTLGGYTPTTNGQQAIDLLELPIINNLNFYNNDGSEVCEIVYGEEDLGITDSNMKLAIVKAVVASKYGMEIDEGLLK